MVSVIDLSSPFFFLIFLSLYLSIFYVGCERIYFFFEFGASKGLGMYVGGFCELGFCPFEGTWEVFGMRIFKGFGIRNTYLAEI